MSRLLAALSTLFIATNLSVGYTFSTLAQNQLQAMQMAMMYFLPNMLLSGFLFPFAGMPTWAQWVGEALPLTHFVRIVRAIMLKGASLSDPAFRRRRARRPDADRHDHRRAAVPPDVGLRVCPSPTSGRAGDGVLSCMRLIHARGPHPALRATLPEVGGGTPNAAYARELQACAEAHSRWGPL